MYTTVRTGQRQNFNNQSYNQLNAGRNFVRNRIGPRRDNREAIIQRNLEHMEQVSNKKRFAQERYYARFANNHQSSVKTASGHFLKQNYTPRTSVQARLGNKNRQYFQNNYNIQNNQKTRNNQKVHNNQKNKNFHYNQNQKNHNNQKTPKKQFFPRNQQFVGELRSDKLIRLQNIQQKKGKLRQSIKTINSTGKVFYLQPIRRASNYTVRVENDNKHHVQKDLNPLLQEEIKMIQNKAKQEFEAEIPVTKMESKKSISLKVDRIPIVATARTLHERFSMI